MKIVPIELAPYLEKAAACDDWHDFCAYANPKGPLRALKRGEIRFTPGQFEGKYHFHIPGTQPDEALLHEMVHATREMRGILNSTPLGWHFDTEEEFFAILLTNIYASETGQRIDLRANHDDDYEHLAADTDEKFLPKRDFKDYRYRLVFKLVHEQPGLAYELRAMN